MQLPVLAFGERFEEIASEIRWGSWATVGAFASFAAPEVVAAQVRQIPAEDSDATTLRAAEPPAHVAKRAARMLLALGRMVLPAWEVTYPDKRRPHDVLDDAARILEGLPAATTDTRRTLHDDAYAKEHARLSARATDRLVVTNSPLADRRASSSRSRAATT